MPSPPDAALNATFANIGITPGTILLYNNASEEHKTALDYGVSQGIDLLMADVLHLETLTIKQHGWMSLPDDLGDYGKDYSTRAAMAYRGFYANKREDAIYF